MDQQITPGVSTQTTSAVHKAAGAHGKPVGQGIFAKLLAIIEGKAKEGNGEGTEKLFKHSAHGAIDVNVATSKSKNTVAGHMAKEKPTAERIKPEQNESSDMAEVDANIAISNNPHLQAGLIAAGKQNNLINHAVKSTDVGDAGKAATASAQDAEAFTAKGNDANLLVKTKSQSDAGKAATASAQDAEAFTMKGKADANLLVKAKSRPEAAPSATFSSQDTGKETSSRAGINQSTQTKTSLDTTHASATAAAEAEEVSTKIRTEAARASIGAAADAGEVAAKAAVDAKQSVKSSTRREAAHASTTSDPVGKEAAAILSKNVASEPSVKSEPLTNEHEKRIEGVKAAMQQATTASLQAEKGISIQPEASAISGVQEQHRFTTNNFIKSRKINLDHSSKTRNTLLQASAEKKPEVAASNAKLPSVQLAESFAGNMKEMIAQADARARASQPSADSANSQAFQVSSLDSSSTLMRSIYQPNQSMSNSGPWTVAAAMQQIGQAAAQGKFQIELTLTPEHLGKVQVFLDSDVNKQIQVHLVVDQPTSRQSIEQHLPALRQALADQGLNMDSFSMASSEQGDEQQQQRPQSRHVPTDTIMASGRGGSEQRPQVAADSRLSIRI